VQDATGGTLSETTLTLTDVSSKTGWFTDRPYREAGQMSTEEFIALWDEGEPFADDPPNADFTCEIETDSGMEVVNYVVELTSPSMAGDDLSYSVSAVDGAVLPETPIACEADSHLFVDSSSGHVKFLSPPSASIPTCKLEPNDNAPLWWFSGSSAWCAVRL
jgi:hypothetical protein